MVPPRVLLAALVPAVLLLAACPASPEAEAEGVAREFLEAMDSEDWDGAWDAAAEDYRNLWRSMHDEAWMAAEDRKLWSGPLGRLEEFREPIGELSPMEIHRGYHEIEGWDLARRSPSGSEPAETAVEGECAVVRFPSADLRVFLRREEGDWRVETWGTGPEGDVFRYTGPYGRELAWFGYTDIVRMDLPPEGFPLLRLPGDRAVEKGEHRSVELIVAEDGTVTYKGEEFADDALRETLFRQAERKRDLGHPAQPSRIELNLAVHRKARWSHAEEVLLTALDWSVRMYRGTFLTRIGDPWDWSGWTGVPYRLMSRPIPRYPDWPNPDVVVEIGPGARDAHVRCLLPALRALPPERLESGVRVRISPDVGAETALRALCVIAANWLYLVVR